MTDFIQQAKDLLAAHGFKVAPGPNVKPAQTTAPAQRALTADEQRQVDEFTAKLTAPVAPPSKDGNAHWPTQPHGAADVFSPHFVPVPDESSEETLGAA